MPQAIFELKLTVAMAVEKENLCRENECYVFILPDSVCVSFIANDCLW